MKTLNPNNKNPKNGLRYDDVLDLLFRAKNDGEEVVGVGNNTTAELIEDFTDGFFIAVTLHETKIANLFGDYSVQLFDGGFRTTMTKKRLDWVLLPLGYRMTAIRGTWKLYHIKTGGYLDYFPGMIVNKRETLW